MVRIKIEKVEFRVTPQQKTVLKNISNDAGFNGNITKLIKDALIEKIFKLYSQDLDKAKEIVKLISG